MDPLIEIKTVPIEIKMTTKNASLEYTRGTAEMEISRSDNGKAMLRSRAIKVQMDKFEPRMDAKRVQNTQGGAHQMQAAAQAGYEVTSTSSRQGELLLNAKIGQEMVNTLNGFSGSAGAAGGAAVAASQGFPQALETADMEIRYEMDKANFDWKLEQTEFKFTPGDIEFSVEQRPDVVIKYMGGPIYVPRSADPNYEPVDVRA